MAHIITIAQQKGGAGKTTLAVNLAIAFARQDMRVAILDTDPQGSLGRWFMARRELLEEPDLEFGTSSAWGVSYECEKLGKTNDIVIIDTPPKVDSDLKPALREADLILVPVGSSHVDLWATDGVVDLAVRVGKRCVIVLNRVKSGTRLADEVAAAAAEISADVATTSLGQRVVYAETLGQGRAAQEAGKSAASAEVTALAAEVLSLLAAKE
ncbi:ParA family partition ATPase [Pseudorhodobacter wandonensis]|jgi:chromosome partitioning protein|uniref:ParA family partition ATPase n=1 Tax=Pseudorhodobacter wandonensis TaxID=1120568 RepID=UPI00067BEFE5|nr:ParA family partition ATPase [Pseudorhodobacter wandonensis]